MLRKLIVAIALLAWAAPALADPTELATQGRLASAGGPVADGSYPMAFALYDQPSGGAELFKEFFLGVPVQGGVFALSLGTGTTKLDSAVFAANKALWVGVTVGTDPELPRQKLWRVPYAAHALTAALGHDLACSGCVGTDDLAKAAVTGDKLATGAVGANHVNFAWAAGESPGGAAKFALDANHAKQADSATSASFAEEAGSAKGLQCTGCVAVGQLADTVPAEWVKAGKLAAVATSGKYSDLAGGPDLSGYGALAAANSWQKAQGLAGGGTLGAPLDFAKQQALQFRFENAAKDPTACGADTTGLTYYNTATQQLLLCDGKKYKLVALVGDVGTAANPGVTCKDILAKSPGAKDGVYHIKPVGAAFQVQCDMTTDGGGWTVIARYAFAAGPDWIAGNNAKEGKAWRSDLGLSNVTGAGSYSHDVAKFLATGVLDDKAAFAVRSGAKLIKGTGFTWLPAPAFDSTPHHTRHGTVTLDGAAVTLSSACYDGCCGTHTHGWDTMAFLHSYGGGCGDIQPGCNQPYVGWGDVTCGSDGEYDTTPGWLMVAGQKGNAAYRFADDLYVMFR